MSPIQQLFLGQGAVATKTYVDDIFSTYLWAGSGSARSINNSVDMTEGGMTWIKKRNTSNRNIVTDTVRGSNKQIFTERNDGNSTDSDNITSFNNNGFSLGTNNRVNENGHTYSSWSFAKSKGFFDVVTWTGNGTAGRQLSHNLGCAPGMVAIKCTSDNHNWSVWHRGLSSNAKTITLNDNAAEFTNDAFNGAAPSSTVIHVSSTNASNANTKTYVAYLFAGGEEGYNSVNFDAATESLSATSSDYAFGTGDFTVEAWIKPTNLSGVVYQNIIDTRGSVNNSTTGFSIGVTGSTLYFYTNGFDITSATNTIADNQWYHIAVVNNGGTIKAYVNGVEKGSFSNSKNFSNTTLRMANVDSSSGQNFVGSISNVRVVKGTAVYTSAFTSPTAPLTNITNTKLLCCNGDLTTSSTIASGTLSTSGSPNTTGTSPFTSPDAVFGDAVESVIKCGSYLGSGSAGLEVNLGWEPQYLLIKNATGTDDDAHWYIVDSMRGISTGNEDNWLKANTNGAELDHVDIVDLTSTGFKLINTGAGFNTSGDTFIFTAIRRPDGYVGKPYGAGEGTSVFAMDTGNNTSYSFDAGFPVDMGLYRRPSSTESWYVGNRLMGGKELQTNLNSAEFTAGNTFDSNTAWANGYNSNYQSWMWKRHSGFDLLAWESGGSGETHFHGLGKAPEMIWIKNRSSTALWRGGHKGLNGGTNPWTYGFTLNNDSAEFQEVGTFWNGVVPSATSFSTGSAADAGGTSGDNYIAMLFASVDGISKVGSYSGPGGVVTITTGFQPRFIMVKKTNGAGGWHVFDTTRGMGSGNDPVLMVNRSHDLVTIDYLAPSSTGWSTTSGNLSEGDYIYYAHA